MKVRTIGIDLAKDVFGVHSVDIDGKTLVHKRVTRRQLHWRIRLKSKKLRGGR